MKLVLNRKRLLKIALIAFSVGAIAWIIAPRFMSLYYSKGTQELIQKEMWADMQSIEFQHRNAQAREPVFIKGIVNTGKNDVIGIPTGDKAFPFSWIVLNSHGRDNQIYEIPQNSNLMISCSYLNGLKGQTNIDEVVEQFLRSRCRG